VKFDTVVGELDYAPGPLVRLDVARQLGISGEKLGDTLVKSVNDAVAENEIIALNSQFFSRHAARSSTDGYLALWSKYLGYVYIREPMPVGPREPVAIRAEDLGLNKMQFAANIVAKPGMIAAPGQLLVSGSKKAVAPALCRVTEVALREGYMIITPLFQLTEMTAFIDGVISEIPDADSCVISGMGYRFTGATGYGGEDSGIITPVLAEDRDLTASDLPKELSGIILIARRGITLEALQRLADEGASGLVLGCIDQDTLRSFSRREPLKDLGALMDLPFPILLMQGFGAAMLESTYQEMASLTGRRGAIDGSTQLRAGVIRPELLVPVSEIPFADDGLDHDAEDLPLQEGMRVVLERQPHFGAAAVIVEIDSELRETSAGTRATLARLRLDSGEECVVPLSNCRPI